MPSVVELLASPPRDATESVLVDWLELGALLAAPTAFAIMSLTQALDLDVDQDEEDIGEADAAKEALFQRIGNEIQRRSRLLQGAYAFEVSSDGRSFQVLESLSDAQYSYLVSLILSHCAKQGLLPVKLKPSAPQLIEARDLFQICSTVAAAGITEGPAFSLGHPRGGMSYHAKLKESWAHFGDGGVVESIHPDVPPQHKDEGIDVLSFWKELDGGPSLGYLVGQVASGANWKEKSAHEAATILTKYWLHPQPVSNWHTMTFIPFDVPESELRRHSSYHGQIMSRLRLAPRLQSALRLAQEKGLSPIDRLADLGKVKAWVDSVLATMRQVAA